MTLDAVIKSGRKMRTCLYPCWCPLQILAKMYVLCQKKSYCYHQGKEVENVADSKENVLPQRKLQQKASNLNKKILHKQETLAQGKDFKRWRLWRCFEGPEAQRWFQSGKEIDRLRGQGFRAKIWAPLPQHKTSGHTHVVVLATFNEFCKLAGIS